jgi:predicted metal-dependent hydrolase
MALDWNQGALAEGLACYRRQEFFETHEHWESVWLRAPEPEKTFLQALIQVAAAFHHLRRGNAVGAASMLKRALGRLEAYPAEFGGVDVEAVRQSIRAWIAAIQADGIEAEELTASIPFPAIR